MNIKFKKSVTSYKYKVIETIHGYEAYRSTFCVKMVLTSTGRGIYTNAVQYEWEKHPSSRRNLYFETVEDAASAIQKTIWHEAFVIKRAKQKTKPSKPKVVSPW